MEKVGTSLVCALVSDELKFLGKDVLGSHSKPSGLIEQTICESALGRSICLFASATKMKERYEDCTYHWQMGMMCAAVVFILFTLFHTPSMVEYLECTIPNKTARVVSVGLIISAVVFLLIGLLCVKLRPVHDEEEQKSGLDHLRFVLFM